MSATLIQEIVEQHLKLDITTKTRKREYVEARGIYFYLTRQYTRMSLSSIGKTMGRDHSTVLHFERLIPHWLMYDVQLKEDYNIINKRVQEAVNANPEDFKTAESLEGFYEKQYKELKKLTEQINKDQLVID